MREGAKIAGIDGERIQLQGPEGDRMSEQKKYYIAGKAYIPEEDMLLCEAMPGEWPQCIMRLYTTENEAFYLVTIQDGGEAVRILNEKEAYHFMDEHAAGIRTENYDAVFGEPERG